MEKYIYNKQNGLHYELTENYYFPCLAVPEPPCIGIWGMRRLHYLRTSKKGVYTAMLLSDTLKAHLEEIDQSATKMHDLLTAQIKAQENITEKLKTSNQLEWVQQMNSVRNRVAKIVCEELIYT